mgnify:CR=1 FL=1
MDLEAVSELFRLTCGREFGCESLDADAGGPGGSCGCRGALLGRVLCLLECFERVCRVLGVVGTGVSLADARRQAYNAVDAIDFPSGFARPDIADRAAEGALAPVTVL